MKDQSCNGVTIPSRMRRLPRFMGMPIPYSTWIHPETHVPDFKTNDEHKRRRCVARRLCAMCGERMNQKIAFIGGPGSIEDGQHFMDAGMHPSCAEFAWLVCPYIVMGRGHAKTHKIDPRAAVEVFRNIPTEPPERMGMMITTDYEIVDHPSGPIVRAGAPESVVWRIFERK